MNKAVFGNLNARDGRLPPGFAASPSRELDAKAVATVTSPPKDPLSTTQYGRKVPKAAEAVQARCDAPPVTGEILFARVELLGEGGHVLQINNGSGREAIVKVRHPSLDQTQLSLFVANGAKVTIEACQNFIGEHYAYEFPGVTALETETTSTEIIASFLSYTLHAVPSGNVRPESILPSVFDHD